MFDGRVQGGTVLADRSWVLENSSNFSGSYNDLINKPALFSGSYNDLTDKPAGQTFDGSYNNLTNKPVLFSGSYNDLTNKPVLFSGSYNDLSNKPSIPSLPNLATVATSGSYADLSNKPTAFANLSGISMQRGAAIDEFSTDSTLAGDSNTAVPTESAVKTYVDTSISNIPTTSLAISDLTDVQITGTPTTGYVLKWNGTKWAPAIDATSGGAGTDADTLNGQSGSYYLNYTNLSNTPDLTGYALKASPSFTGHITVEGVTSTGATGTGKLVFDNSPAFTGTVTGITKAMVGLGNVDNTADANKTVLYATTAGSAPASDVYSWAKTATKPSYTASEIGLGSVTNESKSTMFASPTFTGTVTMPAGSSGAAPLVLSSGTVKSSIQAGAIEYDGVHVYTTTDATTGRGYIPTETIYRYTTNTAINQTVNGDLFISGLRVPMEANQSYEIEFEGWGVVGNGYAGWEPHLIFSVAAQQVNVRMWVDTGAYNANWSTTFSNVQGISQRVASNVTDLQIIYTASVNAYAVVYMNIRAIVDANVSAASTMRLTNAVGGGTITWYRGSMCRVRKLPRTGTGNFA